MNNPPDQTPAAPDYKAELLDLLGLPAEVTDEQIALALNANKEAAAAAQQKAVTEIVASSSLPDAAKNVLSKILMSDRSNLEAILSATQKPALPVLGPPPAPTHVTPTHAKDMTAEEKVAKGNALIEEIKAEGKSNGKFQDYTSARDEARRRNPALFE